MGLTGLAPTPRAFGPRLEAFAADVGDVDPVGAVGGRTAWQVGGTLHPETRLVRAPDGIVELVPDEMTVRVGAGTTVEELQAALAVHHQEVPLPVRPGGTVGGALAVGWSDLRRLGRGPVRDCLLEASIVTASGRLVRAGGPTVKNVTGYDLCRLLVGSLGTIGLLGEVVLRTRPTPMVSRWFRMPSSPVPPPVVPPTTASCLWDGTDLWWLLDGHRDDVERHARALGAAPRHEVAAPPPLPPHRWSVEPGELVTVTRAWASPFVAELGVGTVHATVPQPTRPAPSAVRSLGRRMKETFDPTGRLNPGRDVWAR